MENAWGDQTRFFFELTPDRVLDAVESSGLRCSGRCMALNSFENRVYDVELEIEGEPGSETTSVQPDTVSASARVARRRVAKFYRPGRWTSEQVLEEHQFLSDLVKAEIPAIAPAVFPDGRTLHQTPQGIWYAIFPKVGGRAPDELSDDQLRRIGRLLGRIHNVGAAKSAQHRILLSPNTYGRANLEFLISGNWIPLEFQSRYRNVVERICEISEPLFNSTPSHRIHGDCHLGNLLWNPQGPFFLDFDDMVRGPAVQDLWLVVPGRDLEARRQREVLLEGYEEMRLFDRTTLRLIEPLRALRFIHYAAWIARRWQDPAFPAAFPQFGTHRYWQDETEDLEEQLRLVLLN